MVTRKHCKRHDYSDKNIKQLKLFHVLAKRVARGFVQRQSYQELNCQCTKCGYSSRFLQTAPYASYVT